MNITPRMTVSNNFNQVVCPHCSNVFDLEQAWQDVDGRRFIELMTTFPPLLIRPFYRYLKLFTPGKQKLRWSKALKIAEELAPLIKEAQIKRHGIRYRVPMAQWEQAFSDLVLNRPKSLQLPLTKNAYLLSMLANQAEKVAAIKEEDYEKQKRNITRTTPPKGMQPVANVVATAQQKTKPKKPPKDWRPGSLPKSKHSTDD